ncbi:MAG: enoyl-CoA hydratase-related protein [Gammaproteobacteria bacterium]
MDDGLSTSSTNPVVSRLHGQVLVLTLDRPTVRNAINLEMVTELSHQLNLAESNPAVRCVILTGNNGAFCSGGDLGSMGKNSNNHALPDPVTTLRSVEELRKTQRATALRLHQFPKPTLAALPGAAVGAGFSWALACDLRVMSDTAFLATGFSNMALSGDHGGLFFLTRLVGSAKALELYLLSPRVTAPEALALGLTNWVCSASDLPTTALNIARQLATGAPMAQRFIKQNLALAQVAHDAGTYMDEEAHRQVATLQTDDFREAIQAFKQQRSPNFTGR